MAPFALPSGRHFRLDRCGACEGLLLQLLAADPDAASPRPTGWREARAIMGSLIDEVEAIETAGWFPGRTATLETEARLEMIVAVVRGKREHVDDAEDLHAAG